jgi:hypothetical protein
MPDVALVELPPKKSRTRQSEAANCAQSCIHTVLVKEQNIATVEVDRVSGTES